MTISSILSSRTKVRDPVGHNSTRPFVVSLLWMTTVSETHYGYKIMEERYCVYIMTNPRHTVLYIGETGNLPRRIFEHKNGLLPGFTKKYNCTKLVYVESTDDVMSAIGREKELKGWRRQKKLDLINSMNNEWKDLYDVL